MTIRIFISHSFDHPDKLLRIQKFMEERGIKHVDFSVPVWDQLNDDDHQDEIECRISNCDRLIVILTENCHKSKWINQEVAWGRQYGKPVIGVWPHGEAGSPIPREVEMANAHLIGWRATSLEKALMNEDVGIYRAIDLAEDADFDRAVRHVVGATGAVSLLLIGVQLHKLSRLQATLRGHGVHLDLIDDWKTLAGHALIGAAAGGMAGMLLGALTGHTDDQLEKLALRGLCVGASVGVSVYMQAAVRRFGQLMTIELKPCDPPKFLTPG